MPSPFAAVVLAGLLAQAPAAVDPALAGAEARVARGDLAGAASDYRQLLADGRGPRAVVLYRLADLERRLGDHTAAAAHAVDAAELLRSAGDLANASEALNVAGMAETNLGRFDAALVRFEGAMALSQEAGDWARHAEQVSNLGTVYFPLGRYDEAATAFARARALADTHIGEAWAPHRRAIAMANEAALLQRLGRYADALANNARALAILSPQLEHDALDYLNVTNLRGLVMIAVRRGDETIDALAPGQLAHATLMGATHPLVLMNRAIVALAHGYEGRRGRAAREMAEVAADMHAAGAAMPPVLLSAGRLYRLLGRDDEAARVFAEAETAAGTAAPAERLVAQIRMERALLVTPAETAKTAITEALARLDALYAVPTPWQADGHVALARLLRAEGRVAEAETHARIAVDVWRSLNPDGPWLAEAERLLAPASSTTTR